MPKRNIFFRQENSFWKAEGKWIRFTLLIILLGVISYLITSVKPWKVGRGDSLQVNPSDNYVIIGTWWGFLISSIICSTLLLHTTFLHPVRDSTSTTQATNIRESKENARKSKGFPREMIWPVGPKSSILPDGQTFIQKYIL